MTPEKPCTHPRLGQRPAGAPCGHGRPTPPQRCRVLLPFAGPPVDSMRCTRCMARSGLRGPRRGRAGCGGGGPCVWGTRRRRFRIGSIVQPPRPVAEALPRRCRRCILVPSSRSAVFPCAFFRALCWSFPRRRCRLFLSCWRHAYRHRRRCPRSRRVRGVSSRYVRAEGLGGSFRD